MRSIWFVLFVALSAFASHQAPQSPMLRTTTAGVVVDVSVVGERGEPVVDLRPEDIEVFEDGVSISVKTHGEMNHRPGARLSVGSHTVLPTARFSPATTVEFTAAVNIRPAAILRGGPTLFPARLDLA
jgi:hypothetical protein